MRVRPTGERRRGRRAWAWPLATVGSVLVVLLLPLVPDPRHYFHGDTQAAYYGWWYHLGEQLRAGRWPLLDPHAWRAGNLAAEGQWGLYSPLVMLIGLLATVSGGVLLLATAVKVVLALAGALGVYALARSYEAPYAAAYAAAVAVPAGGVTQHLDLPSWAAALMIWALLPWVWWALRRTMLWGANPVPALGLAYLLVTVGYVYGTIMLILVLVACLVDCRVTRDRVAAVRVLVVAVVSGLVAVAVYLPGVLTAPVTIRHGELGGFGGMLSADLPAMFTSVIPTAAEPGVDSLLLPYAYAAWFLPALLWVDLDRLRRAWRPLAGLFFMTGATLLVVVGPAHLGPLRWPLRLQPFLVQMLVVLCVVLVGRYAVRRPSPRRLAASLLWVLLAGVVAVVRAPGVWVGHLLSVVVVCAGLGVVWLLLASPRRRPRVTAVVVAAFTLGLLPLQHAFYPNLTSPERNMPAHRAAYRTQLSTAEGDALVVGDMSPDLRTAPASAGDLLAGSAWYLNPHAVQNTYTTISFEAYYDRYCIYYAGFTCPELLDVLFSTEPGTGRARVDLLSVSTLLLVRADFPESRLSSPPRGWHVSDSTRWAVTWVRDDPVPGAGGPVWSSPGTTVTSTGSDDRTVRLRVDAVPPGGGRVALSRLAWPGYHTDLGGLGTPVDGYLLTLELPARAAGRVVTVHFSPPGWRLELVCWWVALVLGAGWAVMEARQAFTARDLPRPPAARGRSRRPRARRASCAAAGGLSRPHSGDRPRCRARTGRRDRRG